MKTKYVLIIIIAILGFTFYWFSIRPAQIRKKCTNAPGQYPASYNYCLKQNGLES